jgi:hypothetical protein
LRSRWPEAKRFIETGAEVGKVLDLVIGSNHLVGFEN